MAEKTASKTILRVGIDLGTNTSVFRASKDGKPINYEQCVYPSLVGYSKPGIIPGILPTDNNVLFGENALEYRLHLDLKWPLKKGFVDDPKVCGDFAKFLREQIDPKGNSELWGIVGAPANASEEKQKIIRSVFAGVLDRILIVPEPFLAAMGLRDDERAVEDASYIDPTKHSLIVDIGAGTTDCCLVQGYYPGPNDQVSVPVAGDAIDERLQEIISKRFPDIRLTRVTITKMKENHAFVGKKKDAKIKVYVDGKPKTVDFSDIMNECCEVVVEPILSSIRELLSKVESDAVEHVLQNIILAGGGSQIRGLKDLIQQKLRGEGYEGATVVIPEDYRLLVATGALKIANNVREDQWQVPL